MSSDVDALSAQGVSELAAFIIRPPRARYSRTELGERTFSIDHIDSRRDDVVLKNAKGQHIHASHFRPADAPASCPVVVYLHGNGSCRIEATMLLHYVLPYGLALFAFDFTGSGMSDGEYISLGVNEKYDVDAVVDYLVNTCGVSNIALWGHSMGAATAVMYAGLCDRSPQVKGLLLDSPFASFDKLAQSMVADMPLPKPVPRKLVLSVGVRAVRKVVKDRAGFDVVDIDPLSAAKKITHNLPALFLHGTNDAVVPLSHGQLLYKNYPSDNKHMIVMNGFEHDTPRPEWVMDRAFVFLQTVLGNKSAGTQFLEYVKARGNAAMFARRFQDAAYLYTEALDALARELTGTTFSEASGEKSLGANKKGADGDETEGRVGRRNSSITNFVSTVRRWRHARPLFAAEEGSQTGSHTLQKSNGLHADGVAEVKAKAKEKSELKDQVTETTVPLKKAPSSNDADKNDDGNECARSDSSAWSGRFSRHGSHRRSRAKSFMDTLKNKIRLHKSRSHNTPSAKDQIDESVKLDGKESLQETSDDTTPPESGNGVSITTKPLDDSKHNVTETELQDGNVDSHRGMSWRSNGASRVSRSSSKRMQIRHRGKRRQSSRRARVTEPSIDGEQKKETSVHHEGSKRRKTPDRATFRNRFSASDTLPQRTNSSKESTLTENESEQTDIKSWNMSDEHRTISLALLGNRSLARRKTGDLRGALFDAQLCVDLDGKWIRGYLRKAAALREDKKLEEARECVLDGLRVDDEHAGLKDMLSSLEIAIAAESLEKERGSVANPKASPVPEVVPSQV